VRFDFGGDAVESGSMRVGISQFAFPRNALMLFVCTFNAIFELAPIEGELFGHFVNPAWHIATDCGPEDHATVRSQKSSMECDALVSRCWREKRLHHVLMFVGNRLAPIEAATNMRPMSVE
jgi:hypothetical protein